MMPKPAQRVLRMIATRSITTKLLSVVFSIYIFIATVLTACHLLAEYQNEKTRVLQELQQYQITFSKAITLAMYELNDNQLKSTLEGTLLIPSISGVIILDQDGSINFSAGLTGHSHNTTDQELFRHSAPLIYTSEDSLQET